MYPFELKKVYGFNVHPSTILGSNFQNVTILSIMDYESALQIAPDLPATQVNVYPHLPTGTPQDLEDYDFVKIRLASGINTVLAIPWIDEATITLVESRKMTIVLDGVSSADVERVRGALVQNGYNSIDIKLS